MNWADLLIKGDLTSQGNRLTDRTSPENWEGMGVETDMKG